MNNYPSPDRPILMLRFRIGQESGEIWDRTLVQLQKYPRCCDEVWFSTGLGVAPISTHKQLAAKMAENAAELRKIGIIPSLQFQSTIGHGDGIQAVRDCSGMTWGRYVGKNGEQTRFISCPRQKEFHDYLYQMALLYGAWHPASVWIDDDLRLNNHAPAMEPGGCYCAHCMAEFSKLEGKEWTREALVEACKTDAALQQRWDDFGIGSLRMIAEAIANGLHEVSPETKLALQHNALLTRVPLFHIFQDITGKRCGSRPGGGAYSDHVPYAFMEKALEMAWMRVTQPGYDVLDQVCAEIEDCPRVFSSKTPQGLRIETLFYMATGMDSISYFIMDPLLESPEWYGRELFAPLHAEADCYHEYARHNFGTEPGGIGFAPVEYINIGPLALPLIGVPLAIYSPYAVGKMLRAEIMEMLSDTQLKDILSGNVVLDGDAVAAIQKRGMASLIAGITTHRSSGVEHYTDDPLNEGLEIRIHESSPAWALDVPENAKGQVQVLGRYQTRLGEDNGIASLLLTRKDGTKVAILGCGGFETAHVSSSRVDFLYRVLDRMTGNTLPALPLEPVQCCIVPRITEDKTLRSVTVMNTVIQKQRPFELKLRGVPAGTQSADWLVPAEKAVTLPVRWEGTDAFVTLPEIAAWDIGWLKIGK